MMIDLDVDKFPPDGAVMGRWTAMMDRMSRSGNAADPRSHSIPAF